MQRYNGKPCKKCGGTDRYKSNRKCIACARQNQAEWRKKNPEDHNEYQSKWIQKRATPPWASQSDIDRVYSECDRLSREMRMKFVVIHEIPLQGKNVCGLHIAENLKVVSKSWIRAKRMQLLRN